MGIRSMHSYSTHSYCYAYSLNNGACTMTFKLKIKTYLTAKKHKPVLSADPPMNSDLMQDASLLCCKNWKTWFCLPLQLHFIICEDCVIYFKFWNVPWFQTWLNLFVRKCSVIYFWILFVFLSNMFGLTMCKGCKT